VRHRGQLKKMMQFDESGNSAKNYPLVEIFELG
jgi:hypothetical protein